MHTAHSKTSATPRLSVRYKRFAGFIGLSVFLVALLSTLYVIDAQTNSARSLKALAKFKLLGEQVQFQVIRTELNLNSLLLSSVPGVTQSPDIALQKAIQLTHEMTKTPVADIGNFRSNLQTLSKHLEQYQNLLQFLLNKRKDLNWLYPALPFINGSMLEANQRFETATLLAIAELKDESDHLNTDVAFQRFYKANDLWRRIILNFRAMLIRFSGLQNVPLGASAEEENIFQLLEELDKTLSALLVLKQQGLLGFQGEDAISEMKKASLDWKKGFDQLRKMRLSLYWRADTEYLNTRIKPVQLRIITLLEQVESAVENLSYQDVKIVEKVLQQLIIQFWGIAIFFILLVVAGYKYMQKQILKPVERVSEALWAESKGKTSATMTAGSSMEMEQLVEAFSSMRKQVADRQQALEYQALHDSLTSLPNRVLLNERLEHNVNAAVRDHNSVALFVMDLNGFKEVNDTLGHQVGDLVLVNVASLLQDNIREADIIARLGGDEFAIILSISRIEEAKAVAEKINKLLENNMEVAGHKLHVSVSIGISIFPEHGQSAKILVQRADVAMYMSKRSRSPYVFYDRDQDTHNISWLTLPADLEAAIKNNQLQLFYQPKINGQSGEVKGAEALLRWQHQRHDWVNPEDIVELAESSGMMNLLTGWVLENALCTLVRWNKMGLSLTMAVNLSPHNLHGRDFVVLVASLLAKYNIDGAQLTLEITENAFISDPAHAVTVIHKLRKMGIRISIDDYGTGFSSLSYLKQLSANELKIDKVFVMNLNQNDDDRTIVRSTITMAQNLGLEVVAEGVENTESLQYLRDLGCNYLQGFYISKPIAENDFLIWLDRWHNHNVSKQM